jgi:hypothetical protein
MRKFLNSRQYYEIAVGFNRLFINFSVLMKLDGGLGHKGPPAVYIMNS